MAALVALLSGCVEPRPYGGPIAVDHAGLAGRVALLDGMRATARPAPIDAGADAP